MGVTVLMTAGNAGVGYYSIIALAQVCRLGGDSVLLFYITSNFGFFWYTLTLTLVLSKHFLGCRGRQDNFDR